MPCVYGDGVPDREQQVRSSRSGYGEGVRHCNGEMSRGGGARRRRAISFSELFNLEPLLNVRIPGGGSSGPDDSEDGSRGQMMHAVVGTEDRCGTNLAAAERAGNIQAEMTVGRKRLKLEAEAGMGQLHGGGYREGGDNGGGKCAAVGGRIDRTREYYGTSDADLDRRRKWAKLRGAMGSKSTENEAPAAPVPPPIMRQDVVPHEGEDIGGVPVLPMEERLMSTMGAGVLDGRLIGAAQRRRLRKAKRRLKDAEAMRKLGDPNAEIVAAEANAVLEGVTKPLLQQVLPPPRPVYQQPPQGAYEGQTTVENSGAKRPPSVHRREEMPFGMKGRHATAGILDLGGGARFILPPFYDDLAVILRLPKFSDIRIDERVLAGRLRSKDIMALVMSDPLAKKWKTRRGMGESGEGWKPWQPIAKRPSATSSQSAFTTSQPAASGRGGGAGLPPGTSMLTPPPPMAPILRGAGKLGSASIVGLSTSSASTPGRMVSGMSVVPNSAAGTFLGNPVTGSLSTRPPLPFSSPLSGAGPSVASSAQLPATPVAGGVPRPISLAPTAVNPMAPPLYMPLSLAPSASHPRMPLPHPHSPHHPLPSMDLNAAGFQPHMPGASVMPPPPPQTPKSASSSAVGSLQPGVPCSPQVFEEAISRGKAAAAAAVAAASRKAAAAQLQSGVVNGAGALRAALPTTKPAKVEGQIVKMEQGSNDGQPGMPREVGSSALTGPLLQGAPQQQRDQLALTVTSANKIMNVKSEEVLDPALKVKEEVEKVARYWINLVRKDLPRHHKLFVLYHKKQTQDVRRIAEMCQREVRARAIRSIRAAKGAVMRTRRLARDMMMFWKKADKELVEQKRREEKDAADMRRREEELREARRQQQRLNFLLTQTELYSHFMRNKLMGAGNVTPARTEGSELVQEGANDPLKEGVGGDAGADEGGQEKDANMLEDEEAEMQEQAVRAAQAAASQQRQRTSSFDSESQRLRDASEGLPSASKPPDDIPGLEEAARDMNLLNPSTMPAMSSVAQPRMFRGKLKEYQLKGLQWLVNLYEQGLNGILADEMGLGKTIQAMSFLAHLAEEKNIWGPFLVVAPASTLPNWADEIAKFCSDLRILPYWGGLQERTVLRKNINPKRLYRRDAVFHVLITSYQLLVSDEKYFRRVKWQYMVLDEAQAIKSASSQRWKTLLSFNCRNRLLLTGTPIQNSMAELWALLHFIMPTLFDSHEQFTEWFAKGIESHAEGAGTLNEHQLSRLHSILKPFMLRRVKRDVEAEMTNKKEIVVPCRLTARQQVFYSAIKNKISIADLFDSSGTQINERNVLQLMNIVIQLRKIPKLVFREGMQCLPSFASGSSQEYWEKWVNNRLCIFSPENIHRSLFPGTTLDAVDDDELASGQRVESFSAFAFTRLVNLSPAEVAFLAKASLLQRWLYYLIHEKREDILRSWKMNCGDELAEDEELETDDKTQAVRRLLLVSQKADAPILRSCHATTLPEDPFQPLVSTASRRFLRAISVLRAVQAFMLPARAPQVDVFCSDRSFAYQRQEMLHEPWTKQLLVGFARCSEDSGPSPPRRQHPLIQEVETGEVLDAPLLAPLFRVFGSAPPLQAFDFAKMLTDSGKLQTLDVLLKDLKAGGHRVLLFSQMTKMINILEDYMNYRKYKYLRLDGSSTIMDRRDMVKDFQTRSDIFVFLLSTRAGGLGINLTAADTVIFYESDWNPTMDLQAMDRAHRLGQTKEVRVYRMICTGTVEEKIVKRANQKNTVQQLVMTGGQSQADLFEPEEEKKKRRSWGVGSGARSLRMDEDSAVLMDRDDASGVAASVPGGTGAASEAGQERGNDAAVGVNNGTDGKKGEKGSKTGKAPKGSKGPSENGVESRVKKRTVLPTTIEGKPPKPPKVTKHKKAAASKELKAASAGQAKARGGGGGAGIVRKNVGIVKDDDKRQLAVTEQLDGESDMNDLSTKGLGRVVSDANLAGARGGGSGKQVTGKLAGSTGTDTGPGAGTVRSARTEEIGRVRGTGASCPSPLTDQGADPDRNQGINSMSITREGGNISVAGEKQSNSAMDETYRSSKGLAKGPLRIKER
ncbi:hypothetical protein CBR_g24383 [Chara braunii]|uniref:Chromatin-remodeling ATPase INO80 n=1 Tax=Chara braunii TaxID=69332 RepID=A0A388JML3_CHABU|nr:hypothetical protein CBR_g24383 [Chara braunii]|eukprot:GBG59037.1 hypothetical protein CBR_g24383 [Chara braunii]